MIDCYTWPTPNGHKVHIMLEETRLDWTVHAINIQEGDQFKPEFLEISPNNRMPAMVDDEPADGGEPISLFESGAIMIYLAEKAGDGRLLPADAPRVMVGGDGVGVAGGVGRLSAVFADAVDRALDDHADMRGLAGCGPDDRADVPRPLPVWRQREFDDAVAQDVDRLHAGVRHVLRIIGLGGKALGFDGHGDSLSRNEGDALPAGEAGGCGSDGQYDLGPTADHQLPTDLAL